MSNVLHIDFTKELVLEVGGKFVLSDSVRMEVVDNECCDSIYLSADDVMQIDWAAAPYVLLDQVLQLVYSGLSGEMIDAIQFAVDNKLGCRVANGSVEDRELAKTWRKCQPE